MTKSNSARLFVAWLVVGLPLAWGVYKSIQKSLPLFVSQSAPVAPAPAAGAR